VDLACRFGGEEFVVLMPDTDFHQADLVAERVRQSIAERAFEVNAGRPLSVTVSAGVTLNEGAGDTPEMLIKRADVALYRAKREGRNRVVFDAA
jgi:two-component system cell cycle response regulator